jgi:hypothetical protein
VPGLPRLGPGCDLLKPDTGPAQNEWRGQVCPHRVTGEVAALRFAPVRFRIWKGERRSGFVELVHHVPVGISDDDSIRREQRVMASRRERPVRHPLAPQIHLHVRMLQQVGLPFRPTVRRWPAGTTTWSSTARRASPACPRACSGPPTLPHPALIRTTLSVRSREQLRDVLASDRSGRIGCRSSPWSSGAHAELIAELSAAPRMLSSVMPAATVVENVGAPPALVAASAPHGASATMWSEIVARLDEAS